MERGVLKTIDPTLLLVADSDGDLVRIFRYEQQLPPHAGPAVARLTSALAVNPAAIEALTNMGRPLVHLDTMIERAEKRPRVQIEFEEVEDPGHVEQLRLLTTEGTPAHGAPLSVFTHYGARPFLVHTDFKFIRSNSVDGVRDYRGFRHAIVRLEELGLLSHVAFVSPFTLFFTVPKLLQHRIDEIQSEVRLALVECVEFIWRHWTVPMGEPTK